MSRRSTSRRFERFGKQTRAKVLAGKVEFRMLNNQGANTLDYARRLDNIEKKVKDFSPVFMKFGEYMLRSVDRTHQAQGRPASWEPLAESTQRDRERQGYNATSPILERTGRLRRGYRYEARKRSFAMWNTAFYWIYHQEGTRYIPRRIMLQLLAQDKGQFNRIFNRHLSEL